MKKYIVILTFMLGPLCFSQGFKKTDIDIRFDQAQFRIQDQFKIMKQPVSTFIIVRFNRLEFYEEIKISVDKYTALRLGVGGDYKYETGIISPRLRFNAVSKFGPYDIRINIGSDIKTYGVSTRIMRSLNDHFSLGIQAANEFYGPRAEWRFKAFKRKDFKLSVSYLSDGNPRASLKFDVLKFFPKIEQKIKKWENDLNQKLDKVLKKNKDHKG